MKTFLLSLLLLPLLSNAAFGNEEKLRKWIDSSSWAEGTEYCDQKLADDLARRPDVRSLSADTLARLATYCAALASGKGDEAGTGWWWYTAAGLHLKTAQDLLPEMQQRGLLKTLPEPRGRAVAEEEKGKVRLLSGEVVDGAPAKPLPPPRYPKYMFRLGPGVAATEVEVELVVPRDGVPRQPLLLSAQALPVHALFTYRFLSAWRFEPAKVNGEPVDCIYKVKVSTKRAL
ncbi:MAG TPA: hypothetical protein VJ725_27105 [Thermoanaerobaculia bacterium]|nr:hypothetical protein [Thermoanaerobaculia bacterium]